MRISDWSSDVCSSDLRTGHEDYLRRLDGMVIGDSPDQGFVRGRHFIHPTLRFTFTVPPEFTLANGPAAVRARAANGAVIVFDTTRGAGNASMPAYLRQQWGRQLPLTDLASLTINGMEAATGTTRLATTAENGRAPV